MSASLRTRRTDRVASLFLTSRATVAAERALDKQIGALVTGFLRARAVAAPADLAALAGDFAPSEVPAEPLTPAEYVGHLAADVVPYCNRIASPRSLAHMNQGLPYFMRSLARLLTGMNQNLTKFGASRALSLCERQALAMMHRLVYDGAARFYERHAQNGDSTLGVVTSGGTVANITALRAARNASLGPRGDFGGVEREGLLAALRHHGHTDAVVIGPESMYYSFTKAAGLLGIGERGLIRVPTDYRGRMHPGALRQTAAACRARHAHVLAVVGVAGSTDAGAIDPLNEVADVAEEAGAHFHVDAAWGGPLLFSDEYRPLGLPAGLMVALDYLAFAAFLLLVGRLGPAELTATSIAFTLNLIPIPPVLGVAQAVAVLVGRRLGEGRPDLARRTTWTGFGLAMSYTAAVAVLLCAAPDLLAAAFRVEGGAAAWGDVARHLSVLLRFVAVYSLFDCLTYVLSSALRGAGDTRFVTAAALGLSWAVMVLPAWVAWHYGWGLHWAWAFASLYVIMLSLTVLARFRRGRWQSLRVIGAAAVP